MRNNMALLGVIGGLGPMATAYFMELVTSMTDALTDQEHIRMLVYSVPDTPDRTDYILGKSIKDPLPCLIDAGLTLKEAGADVIAIPCITAHYFHDKIEKKVGVQILNAISDSAELLKSRGIAKVGIMATEGTVKSGLFRREFEKKGISAIVPDDNGQNIVTSLIFDNVKKGITPDMDAFFSVKNELLGKGAEMILLGCTELSVIKKSYDVGDHVFDVMEALAASAIEACGKTVRKEYSLI